MRYIRIFILLIIVSGCASLRSEHSQLTTSQHEKAHELGKFLIGKTADDLVKVVPNIKAEEYSTGKYRYTIQYSVMYSTAEAIAYDANFATMFIYLFTDNKGVITHYNLERKIF